MSRVALPPFFRERSTLVAVTLAVAVPIVYGGLCGVMLGVSKTVYVLLSVLAIPGGFVAGLEHDDPLEGVWRGLLGGLLFGTTILVTFDLIETAAKASLPNPHTLLIVITAVGGAALGALGARTRERRGTRR